MPIAPPIPCRTCGRIHCPTHSQRTGAGWDIGRAPVPRIRGAKLQAMRRRLFAKHPVCQVCEKRAATIRDHTIPLAEGGLDDETNESAVCESCHREKSQREAQRGKTRAQGG